MSDTPATPIPVCIVGAGPAGLATAACLAKKQMASVVLERGSGVGSSWRNHYERLHLHTAKQHSGLPHLAFPASAPIFPSRKQVVDYLEAYAAAFGIQPVFGVDISSISRSSDGIYTITAPGKTYQTRQLVVATGCNRSPHRVRFPGEEDFVGAIVHSASYRNGLSYKGKRVLVVGIGNTGGEIAIDLCEYGAAEVYLCVRGPINIIPREVFGRPTQSTGILLSHLPRALRWSISKAIRNAIIGDLSAYGLITAKESPMEQIERFGKIPLIDIGTVDLVKQGRIKVVPGIDHFVTDGVRCSDGREYSCDVVILATGYQTGLPDIMPGLAKTVLDEDGVPIADRGVSAVPGLYFVGFRNPSTGLLRGINQDARRVARAIEKK